MVTRAARTGLTLTGPILGLAAALAASTPAASQDGGLEGYRLVWNDGKNVTRIRAELLEESCLFGEQMNVGLANGDG